MPGRDVLAQVRQLAAESPGEGGPDRGALETQAGHLEVGLGGGESRFGFRQLRLPGRERRGVSESEVAPLAPCQLGLRQLAVEADAGLGDAGLRLGDRQLVVARLDSQQGLAPAEGAPLGKAVAHGLHPAGDLRDEHGVDGRCGATLAADDERSVPQRHGRAPGRAAPRWPLPAAPPARGCAG